MRGARLYLSVALLAATFFAVSILLRGGATAQEKSPSASDKSQPDSAKDPKTKLKTSAISRAIEAIEATGSTYGFHELGGEKFGSLVKRLGYDERSYYTILRLSLGRINDRDIEPMTDAGLASLADHIAVLLDLELLDLRANDLTQRGLESLPPLPKLKHLRVDGKGITDDIAKVVTRFPALTTLELQNTVVTPAGVEAIKKQLPACKVIQ